MNLPNCLRTPQYIQLFDAIIRPLESLEVSAQHYGDYFTSQLLGYPPFVVFSSPQAIEEMFCADSNVFEINPGNKIIHPLVGNHSLLLLDGPNHQRQRRLLMPPFHGERMRTYGNLICDITEQVMSQANIDQSTSVRSLMQDISLRIILRTIFGLNETQNFQQLRQLLSSILDFFGTRLGSSSLFIPQLQTNLGSWSPWGRFLHQKQQIDQLIYNEIWQRKKQRYSSQTDILSLLLAAHDEAGQRMTDEELHDELITLLFAGHETTASALSWALHWIHHLPEVHNRLLKELDNVVDKSDSNAIAKLPYLNAVCQETLRIYPIAMFAFVRTLKSPLKVMEHEFDVGTQLVPCIYLTHHRESLYPEPKQFKPERFLERQFSQFEYLPFGGGNRRCIGMAFAQFEMKLVLATILEQFQLSFPDNRPVRPIRRGLTLAPSDMRVVITRK